MDERVKGMALDDYDPDEGAGYIKERSFAVPGWQGQLVRDGRVTMAMGSP